ncbi:hypothetical protein PPERSA_12885 [Pseudocohnilembus persalinus]|uniref:Uncharacterized protein n=1 Tax=Pseudocohnilembus persalinus TaxID=266149 RepID=A0A0V0Q881_PSEPJ|nr:hypothetical protein PPERSA_12885 [Pseudocohnilembus persalinus]|eukprot:KRW98406.1 hypothetical protein PPERSA_12885 [Pseudocohnilembus persalinus]
MKTTHSQKFTQVPPLFINYQQKQFFKATFFINLLHQITQGLTQSQAQGQIQVQIQNEQQKNINSIEIKFKEISQYIISKFKHAFMRIEVKNIQTLLKIIDQFKMVDTITSYYIEHFLSDLKINNQFKDREFSSSQEDLETQFFLLQKAFKRVLSVKISQETNFYQVQQIFGGYSQIVIRQFIKYSFEHIIDKLQDNLLDDKYKNGIHYQWLKIFEFLWNKCLELEKVIQHIDFGENFTLQAFTKDIFSSFLRNSFEQKKNFYFEIEITYLETVMKDNTYQLIDQIKQEAKEKTVYYNKSEKLKYELQKWIDYKIKHKDQEKPKLNKEQMEGRIEVLQQILVMDNINIIFHKEQPQKYNFRNFFKNFRQ